MTTQSSGKAVEQNSVAQANFAAYANPLVNEAIEEAAALRATTDAEKLHRLRIALRRLRTLLWAYRPVLDERFDNEQRAVLKFLANAAGNTRDWDILIGLVEEKSGEQLLSAFKQSRKEIAEQSRETLLNLDLTRLLRDAVGEANRELKSSSSRTSVTKLLESACPRRKSN